MFRFSGYNDLNKEDQTELKKKFGSTTTLSRKRKGDKTLSTTDGNGDTPKAKQSKKEENNTLTNEQDETHLKKVSNFILKFLFRKFLFIGTK